MADEIYMSLTITGPADEIARFCQTPFPETFFDLEGREDEAGMYWFQFSTKWELPHAWLRKIVAEFPVLVFEGSAASDQHEWYLTFDGRNGHLTEREGDYQKAFGEDECHDARPAIASL